MSTWLDEAKRDQIDARRWRKLMGLCGYLQDSSSTTVQLYQDDATRTSFITVSPKSPYRKDYFVDGGSFNSAIDLVPDKDE